MDLNSVIILGCFAWASYGLLSWPVRHLYRDINDFNTKGEYKNALNSLKEQSVRDVTAKARDDFLASGVNEQYALVRAKTARGFSVAKFFKNSGMDGSPLHKVVKHAREKVRSSVDYDFKYQPVFVENRYLTLGGFGHEMFRDIEAENFFLFDKHANKTDPLIKVFPSKKTVVLERNDRVTGQTPFTLLDSHKMQLFYEGQTLCLFGKLIYDAETDSFNFNEVLGMYRGDKLQELVESFKSDRFWDVLSICKWSAALLACGWLTWNLGSVLISWVRQRRQQQKTQALEKKLREKDDQERIEGAPQHTRRFCEEKASQEQRTLYIDTYSCAKCGEAPRTIVMLPCKHCELCEACFRKLEDKKQCSVCHKKAEKYLRILPI